MRRKRLFWWLFPSYLIVIVLSLAAIAWYASSSYKRFVLDQTAADLEVRGRLLVRLINPFFAAGDTTGVQDACTKLSETSSVRVTVVLPSGKVICDSRENPALMDNHVDRPEIIAALQGDRGQAIRFSFTLQQNMMYVAVPVDMAGRTAAVLRTSMPITNIETALESVYARIAFGGIVVTVIFAIISFFAARSVTRPLEQIRYGAQRYAAGELEHKLPASSVREIGGLAEAMNTMAQQLHERIQSIVRQRNEQEAVLSSMVEGVLAVDTDEYLIGLNRAAAHMLQIAPEEVKGRTIHEIVRNPALIEFIGRVLSTRESAESEIVLRERGPRYLQVHGTILRDAEGNGIGVLVVLNDVTRMRRLESIRRDFVANVSHELKTPVTSIKGFVETLLDGAIDDAEKAKRFVGIIGRQADRLQAIIEDLLTLSRLEQETDRTQIPMRKEPLKPVIEAAVGACEVKASEKNISVIIDCDEEIAAEINAPLLEQAIVNLVDNAVEYSRAGGTVEIRVEPRADRIVISVTDYGTGIPAEHLPRLFERFYRVDRARDRNTGSTGLGLSIVKHIAQVHGGYPEVKSMLGRGSTFSIHLPVGGSPIAPEDDV